MKDLFWCSEGCGFVDKYHRCEQWCIVIRIPGEAVKAILDSNKKGKKSETTRPRKSN